MRVFLCLMVGFLLVFACFKVGFMIFCGLIRAWPLCRKVELRKLNQDELILS